METGLPILTVMLISIILLLWLKIRLMQKSADEINNSLAQKLTSDTNTLIDISSRDRHMQKLAESINCQLRELRRQRLRFQQGNLEVTETITNLSHDLRTPLTAICGYLDLLEKTTDPQETSRYLQIIKSRTEVLKQLSEELFRYFSATSEISGLTCQSVVLNSALEEILSAYYAALKSRKITPAVRMPETKITRSLNKNALSRILGNIISNALKYSDGDLSITLSDDGQITFSNHASKLNELQAMRLFDRFYTVETAAKSTGLGLSIAKELTEQMGGSISAEYDEGMLHIVLSFPVHEASH
ncbi:MAG: HAMP domain-containing histidine kinase [Lachnospiraceae bacterium]|nr:HAMP domain-containing histidine kinase [Lachnospiraceae bacterium]